MFTSNLAAFAVTSLIIELTPGPNMAYLAILSVSTGRRAGYAATAGVALGLLVIGIAAALGLTAVISASPLLFQIMRWVGIVYLLWLAWDGWRTAGAMPADQVAPSAEDSKYFLRGFLTNVLNPKAGLFYVAVLPGFIDPALPLQSQAIALTLVYVLIATLIHLTIVTLAGSARQFLAREERIKITARILSVMLAVIAVWFWWSTRLVQ